MKEFTVEFADAVIGIRSSRENFSQLFKLYLSDKTPQFYVEATAAEIEKMKAKLKNHAGFDAVSPDKQAEFTELCVVHELIARDLLNDGVLLIHGSAIADSNGAYLFIAPSGTGKSTHTELWRKVYGSQYYVINDDKPMLRPTENGVIIYATPWGFAGKPARGTSARLRAIISLERGEENRIWQVDKRSFYADVIKASLRGNTPQEAVQILTMEQKILESVACCRMTCNTDPQAAVLSHDFLNAL